MFKNYNKILFSLLYNAFYRCGEPSYDICGEPSKAVSNLPILWRTFLWRTFPVANLPDSIWRLLRTHATNKAQKTLNMLKRNLNQASTSVKSQAYKTIVRPQFECISHLGSTHGKRYVAYMYNVNKIPNYAARWVHHDY